MLSVTLQALDRAEAAADSDTAATSASAAELLVDCARCLQQLCRLPAGQRAVQVGMLLCASVEHKGTRSRTRHAHQGGEHGKPMPPTGARS